MHFCNLGFKNAIKHPNFSRYLQPYWDDEDGLLPLDCCNKKGKISQQQQNDNRPATYSNVTGSISFTLKRTNAKQQLKGPGYQTLNLFFELDPSMSFFNEIIVDRMKIKQFLSNLVSKLSVRKFQKKFFFFIFENSI